jgi:thiol:disulfide interchange protein DsbD
MIVLAVIFDIDQGFHVNADRSQLKPAGDFNPVPTAVSVLEAGDDLSVERPRYPAAQPVKADYVAQPVMSFAGRAVVYLPVKVAAQALPGPKKATLKITYQTCDARTCRFPRDVTLSAVIEVVGSGRAANRINRDIFADYVRSGPTPAGKGVRFDLFGWNFSVDTTTGGVGFGMVLMLLVAALGGLLLNFTPCVLPMIPIKIMSLSQSAANRRRCFILGLSMSLGVVFFWLALGSVIAFVAGFTATSQLFNYPVFTLAVGVIIALMAAGMGGWFSVNPPQFVYRFNPSQESLPGSFALGILTAILSTPCTAPFMGAAAAWAASRHWGITMAVFAAIGIGMALPYLLLSAFPALVSRVPRSGPGSELVKQVMAFFMLAAAAYFIGTGLVSLLAEPPAPPSRSYWWAVMGFCAAAGAWLAWRTWKVTASAGRRLFFTVVGLVVVAGSIYGGVQLTDRGPINWEYYTPQRLEKAFAARKVVVMDFTAEWCLNCKALEQGVLHDPRIVAQLKDRDVVAMKVDITGKNPVGRAMLKKAGRLTIPLLVIYNRRGKPVFNADFYTVEQVLSALDKARQDQ